MDIYKAVECTPDEELFHFQEVRTRHVRRKKIFITFWDDKLAKNTGKPWRERNWLPLRWQM